MPAVKASIGATRYVMWMLLATLLPWSALLEPLHPINNNVSWFFYVAQGVLRGGTLYRDFVDPNAPLASLILIPAVWLKNVLRVAPGLAVEILVLAYASICMALCLAVLRRLRVSGPRLLVMLLSLTAAFVFLEGDNFGEREHILAVLLTPYVLGCIAASAGVGLPAALACAIGVAAALAVGVKPPFILVPASLEALALARTGIGQLRRTQCVAFGISLVVLTAATLVFFPLYATSVVPWTLALYPAYSRSGNLALDLRVGLCTIFAIWFLWYPLIGQTARSARACLTVASIAALIVYAVQGKVWTYQLLPAGLLVFLLAAGAVATADLPQPTLRARWLLRTSPRMLAMIFCFYMVLQTSMHPHMRRYAGLEAAVAAEPGPFVFLDTNFVPGFQIAFEQNRIWASRMPGMIMLPGLIKAEASGQASPWEAIFRSWIVEDMHGYVPKQVFILRGANPALPPNFDLLAWLLRDAKFALIWSHYHEAGMVDGYRLFRLSA